MCKHNYHKVIHHQCSIAITASFELHNHAAIIAQVTYILFDRLLQRSTIDNDHLAQEGYATGFGHLHGTTIIGIIFIVVGGGGGG